MSPDPDFTFVAEPEAARLTVSRDFAGPRALVWECHTRPELLQRWFAPRPYEIRTKSHDLAPGGHWLFAMVAPDGSEHWSRIDYRSVTAPEGYTARDCFCDADGVPLADMPAGDWEVTFAETGTGTRVVTRISYATPEDLAQVVAMGMEEGMGIAQSQLDRVLAEMTGAARFEAVTIAALVEAPAETVWARYTGPEHITRWNQASDDWWCPSARVELRVGGAHVARMEARDGSMGFDFEAVYDEVAPPHALAMTLGDGRRVRVTFVPEGAATRVTTVFDAEGSHPVEMQRDGWQAILNSFKAYAETD